MNARSIVLAVALLVVTLLAGSSTSVRSGGPNKSGLTDDDKKYLEGLMQEFLFDPKGAERVAVKMTVRTVWGSAESAITDGWLVAARDGKPGRVYFADGGSIPAPAEKEMKKIDFPGFCKARYGEKIDKKDDKKKGDPETDETFATMRRTATSDVGNHDLALAAWLYRLGHDGLAAKALATARTGEGDPRQHLRGELAWSAFAGMVHAYLVRADEEAFAHGERYLQLYGKDDKEKQFAQAAMVVAELKRRQKKGTFGKAPAEKWPDGFDQWEAKKKIAFLIDALEEVDARQTGQPGGVDLASDRRVEELIRIGDAAVPALIDALEKDERLTRSVHFWRDSARSRVVLSVREAELTALMSILRVSVFEPASTGDNFTARGEDAAIQIVKRLRAYWKEYGAVPFDERMMKVLTDPRTNFEAKQEAAGNLASILRDRRLRTTFHPTAIGDNPPPKVNPVIAKFSKPTVAEAILAAIDYNLKQHAARKTDD
jgi:hypothetical protein